MIYRPIYKKYYTTTYLLYFSVPWNEIVMQLCSCTTKKTFLASGILICIFSIFANHWALYVHTRISRRLVLRRMSAFWREQHNKAPNHHKIIPLDPFFFCVLLFYVLYYPCIIVKLLLAMWLDLHWLLTEMESFFEPFLWQTQIIQSLVVVVVHVIDIHTPM